MERSSLDSAAIVAIVIFALTYITIATGKVNRTVIVFIGGLLLLLFGVFYIKTAVSFISWETIGLLSGMFIMVALLSDPVFFSFLVLKGAKF
ncbi:MAG: hypothetical protein R6U35_00315 [Candidatus Humimicrobiaceae bacterium]